MANSDQPDDGLDLFRELMHDVARIKADDVVLRQKQNLTPEQQEERRKAAQASEDADSIALSEEVREWVEPNDPIFWRKNGVQDGVFRQLKRGQYEPQATLNLHQLRVREARREVAGFIMECYRTGVRTALIIHGLGLKSQPRPALLKSLCNQWLPDLEPVLAFHSAQKKHGGAGATYVMIRKNSTTKLANKEKNRKR
ncbi:DNA endonuclease SmrA [Aliidiomarina halalkaliphila]|uniref:DNA endonuclease SmrA n=1 Tax=Aliidiomarina halalkaliphila TaxID=2593535 RepID=A0A552X5N7_9GAMM|nr:DNA endonuclease SmrA [Aliidiomarina halalkaliphila]TRW50296.1 DNA endonuclease SmrA [Aliidiomarina halalkaliphila]